MGKVGETCGDWLVEDVEKMWRRCGERGGESCRKVRRVVGRRREEDVEKIGERGGEVVGRSLRKGLL